MRGMTEWIIVRDGSQIIGDVYASGRRQALTKLWRVFGGEMQGTGAFNDVLIGSRLAGRIKVWKPAELDDPRLFPERPADPKVKIVNMRVFERLDGDV